VYLGKKKKKKKKKKKSHPKKTVQNKFRGRTSFSADSDTPVCKNELPMTPIDHALFNFTT
jgi:hypothetical protein